jgi:hypothetical protein
MLPAKFRFICHSGFREDFFRNQPIRNKNCLWWPGHKRIQHPNVKKASKPRTVQDTFNDLLSNIQKSLGIHHIRTILFSLPVNYLKDLRDFGLNKGGVDPFSPKYRLSSIICRQWEQIDF